MFKSVFAKYMVTIVLIIVISFTMLSAIISSLVQGLASERTQDKLYQTADYVRLLVEVGAQSYEGSLLGYLQIKKGNIMRFVSKIDSENQGITVFITDAEGKIVLSTEHFEDEHIIVDESILKQVFEKGEYIENGTVGSVLEKPNYVRALPIIKNEEDFGSIFVCASLEYDDGFTTATAKTVVMTSLWVMLVTLVAVYFITRRITVPLRNMSKAAKSFAQGKFDVRVPVVGSDEVAQLATAFNNMAESLESYEENSRNFLNNVSHDLRTPMFNISGFIENILSGAIPESEQKKYLKIIEEEVRRLSRLVSSLLDISRIQAGEKKFFKFPFDICEMARQIIILFEQKIEQKNLQVSFDCEEDKMYVLADRDAIYQVLYNICDNAIKFSSVGGEFRVSIVWKDKMAHVSVYNEGQGLSKDDISKVFGRFYKTDKSRGEDKMGVGLGLYIVKTIIDAHEEEVWINSDEGKNCEFVFTLTRSSEKAFKTYKDELNKTKK